MSQMSANSFLKRAEEQFSSEKYNNALTSYSLLLKEYPENREAKIGVLLCDIGIENSEEAQALFDYYQIIKSDEENATETMMNLLNTLDSSKPFINELIENDFNKIEYKDGILYEDFLEFIDNRGDFKRAFEDIMFSTKVILKDKKEYVAFIDALIERGEDELALQFLDSSLNAFSQDQEIYALYDKLKEK